MSTFDSIFFFKSFYNISCAMCHLSKHVVSFNVKVSSLSQSIFQRRAFTLTQTQSREKKTCPSHSLSLFWAARSKFSPFWKINTSYNSHTHTQNGENEKKDQKCFLRNIQFNNVIPCSHSNTSYRIMKRSIFTHSQIFDECSLDFINYQIFFCFKLNRNLLPFIMRHLSWVGSYEMKYDIISEQT